MSATQVILLERVDNLGAMGDVVNVKPGFARNYLLPQKKALRASKENLAYFEAQKKSIEAESAKKQKEAEKIAKSLEGVKAPLIRQASEAGKLFGSVNARDIADAVSVTSGQKIDKTMIRLNDNIKMIGLFNIEVTLHPEVKVDVTINVARSREEAETQAKTGKALISDDSQQTASQQPASQQPELADVTQAGEEIFEESALEEIQAEAEAKAKAEKEAETERSVKAAAKADKKSKQRVEEDSSKKIQQDEDESE
ncbi:MAG: 50S ribosomal protein L9 [Alphaproteobacteria bacterium]|nr:50S ribosomal protein L9 [Alphaproteobacteria bacterium]